MKKQTYTIVAMNDQGASTAAGIDYDHPNGGREFASVSAASNAAHRELGSGWHVSIIRDDGTTVKEFTTR